VVVEHKQVVVVACILVVVVEHKQVVVAHKLVVVVVEEAVEHMGWILVLLE